MKKRNYKLQYLKCRVFVTIVLLDKLYLYIILNLPNKQSNKIRHQPFKNISSN